MATQGRLEGRITVPVGGWTATVGAGTATIAAGTYYPSTLLTAAGVAFASAGGTTCTASASLGETGTGIATIAFGVAKAITWVSTDLRDILGFAGNVTSATTHVGTMHMRGVWLPDCAYKAPNAVSALWQGHRESDFVAAENAAGHVFASMSQERVVNELSWQGITRARVWIANEAVVNESWERFARDCIWGVATWGTAAGPVRFYPDAGDAVIYATYRVPSVTEIRPEPLHDGWAGGPWTIRIPRLVVVPS